VVAPLTGLGVLEFFDQSDRTDVASKRARSLAAARHVDAQGYQRLLIAEHHGLHSPSASPLQWAAVVASMTQRVRIGTAVTLLRVRNPYLTAVEFATLAAIAGSRVDVGIGRGDIGGEVAHHLDQARMADTDLEKAIGDLREILVHGNAALPATPGPPEFWIHGTGPPSAELAGRLSMGYCFGLFLCEDLDLAIECVARAREQGASRTAVALTMIAGDQEAAYRDSVGVRGTALNLVGTVADCIASIRWIVTRTKVDEIVLAELSSDLACHLEAIDGVAAAIGAS
jgi:alkanesulfonate monooxygenase SsuD/methylene tetrahydromethanopterin reductase-like flavin-dependent oxidoreductase (luciferase family)